MIIPPGFCYLRWFHQCHLTEDTILQIRQRLGPYPPLNRVLGELFVWAPSLSYHFTDIVPGANYTFHVPSVGPRVPLRDLLDEFHGVITPVGSEEKNFNFPIISRLESFGLDVKELAKEVLLEDLRSNLSPLRNEFLTELQSYVRPPKIDGRCLTVNLALTGKEQKELSQLYPELKLSFSKNPAHHDHAFSAVSRKCELVVLLGMLGINNTDRPTRGFDVLIKEFGGNPCQYVREDFSCAHVCAPILDAKDAQRHSNWVDQLRQMKQSGKYKDFFISLENNATKLICNRKAQNCDIRAPYGICLHSVYDMTPTELADAMARAGMVKLVGTVLFDPRMFVEREGFLESVRCHWRTDFKTIEFFFDGDSSWSYIHDYKTYISLFVTPVLISTDRRSVYFVEFSGCRGGVYYFTVIRNTANFYPEGPIKYRFWLPASVGCDQMIIDYYDMDSKATAATGSLKLRRHRIIAPKRLVELARGYAMDLNATKFTVANVYTYLRGANTRCIVNGVEIQATRQVDADTLLKLAHAIYIWAFEHKYTEGRVMAKCIEELKSAREYQEKSFMGKLVYLICHFDKFLRARKRVDVGSDPMEMTANTGLVGNSFMTCAFTRWLMSMMEFPSEYPVTIRDMHRCYTVQEYAEMQMVGGNNVVETVEERDGNVFSLDAIKAVVDNHPVLTDGKIEAKSSDDASTIVDSLCVEEPVARDVMDISGKTLVCCGNKSAAGYMALVGVLGEESIDALLRKIRESRAVLKVFNAPLPNSFYGKGYVDRDLLMAISLLYECNVIVFGRRENVIERVPAHLPYQKTVHMMRRGKSFYYYASSGTSGSENGGGSVPVESSMEEVDISTASSGGVSQVVTTDVSSSLVRTDSVDSIGQCSLDPGVYMCDSVLREGRADGDGNCLFHSLIAILKLQMTVRAFKDRLLRSVYVNQVGSEDRRILEADNEWGSDEIVRLTALEYKVNICLHTTFSGKEMCIFYPGGTGLVHLRHTGNHFNPLFEVSELDMDMWWDSSAGERPEVHSSVGCFTDDFVEVQSGGGLVVAPDSSCVGVEVKSGFTDDLIEVQSGGGVVVAEGAGDTGCPSGIVSVVSDSQRPFLTLGADCDLRVATDFGIDLKLPSFRCKSGAVSADDVYDGSTIVFTSTSSAGAAAATAAACEATAPASAAASSSTSTASSASQPASASTASSASQSDTDAAAEGAAAATSTPVASAAAQPCAAAAAAVACEAAASASADASSASSTTATGSSASQSGTTPSSTSVVCAGGFVAYEFKTYSKVIGPHDVRKVERPDMDVAKISARLDVIVNYKHRRDQFCCIVEQTTGVFVSRAAIKLHEVLCMVAERENTDVHSIVGSAVLDLCGAPGGFAQYLASCINTDIVYTTSLATSSNWYLFDQMTASESVKLMLIRPYSGIGSICDDDFRRRVCDEANGVRCVVADGAYAREAMNITTTADREIILSEISVIETLLAEGGNFVIKLFFLDDPGVLRAVCQIVARCIRYYFVKPRTSRPTSGERYLVGIGYTSNSRDYVDVMEVIRSIDYAYYEDVARVYDFLVENSMHNYNKWYVFHSDQVPAVVFRGDVKRITYMPKRHGKTTHVNKCRGILTRGKSVSVKSLDIDSVSLDKDKRVMYVPTKPQVEVVIPERMDVPSELSDWIRTYADYRNEPNGFKVVNGSINIRAAGMVMHFINPMLNSFPQGFARLVAETHVSFDLENFTRFDVNGLCCYVSINKYGCTFIHVVSTQVSFMVDLRRILEYLCSITFLRPFYLMVPAVGMGKWRHNPSDVLRLIDSHSAHMPCAMVMFVQDRQIFSRCVMPATETACKRVEMSEDDKPVIEDYYSMSAADRVLARQVRPALLFDDGSFTTYCRNSVIERLEMWRASEMLICEKYTTVYNYYQSMDMVSLAKFLENNPDTEDFGFYNSKTHMFIHKPKHEGQYECVFTGERFIDWDEMNIVNAVVDGIYLVGRSTELMQDHRLYAACKDVSITTCPMELVEGVPGCGKTTYILKNHQVEKDMVLFTTREGAEDFRSRMLKHFNLADHFLRSHYRTIHSLLLNKRRVFHIIVDCLWIDEALMNHFGEIVLAVSVVKPRVVRMLGDRKQIPFICRISNFQPQYHLVPSHVPVSKSLNLSYRCTLTVAALLHSEYDPPMFSCSSVRDEMQYECFQAIASIRHRTDTQYLTFKQSEKKALQQAGFKNVNTVHEFQGKEAAHIVVVRTSNVPSEGIYMSVPHALVAITRHTQTFLYVAPPIQDAVYRFVQRARSFDDSTYVTVYRKKGGYQQLLPFTNVENLAREFMDGPRGHRYDPFAAFIPKVNFSSISYSNDGGVTQVMDSFSVREIHHDKDEFAQTSAFVDWSRMSSLPGVVYERSVSDEFPMVTPYVRVNYAHCVTSIQTFIDTIFPQQSIECMEHDCYRVAVEEDLLLHMGTVRINLSKLPEVNKPRYDTLSPVVRTSMPEKRRACTKETLLAMMKRNCNVPELSGLTDEDTLALVMLRNFVSVYLKEDKGDPVTGTLDARIPYFEEWLRGQLPRVRSQVVGDNILEEMDVSTYEFIIKNQVKPRLTQDATNQYSALQTIAFLRKCYNAVYCPLFREMKKRIIARLKDKYIIFTDISVEEFERQLNRRMISTKHVLEVDISKYDKSQGSVILKFECLLMLYFGFDPYYVDLWRNGHIRTKLKDYHNKVEVNVVYQRKSGDPATFIGNTVTLMAMLATIYDMRTITFGAFAGDDSILCSELPFRDLSHLVALNFNFETKFYRNMTSIYFCSRFLIRFGDYWYVVPDPVKLAVKLGRHDLVNWAHVEDYRVSLKDLIYHYGNALLHDEIHRSVCDRYQTTGACTYAYLTSIYNIVQDPCLFRQLYYEMPGAKLCMDPSRPNLD